MILQAQFWLCVTCLLKWLSLGAKLCGQRNSHDYAKVCDSHLCPFGSTSNNCGKVSSGLVAELIVPAQMYLDCIES